MKITKSNFNKTIDKKFVDFLSSSYADDRTIDKDEIAQELVRKMARNEYAPSLPVLLLDYDKGNGVCRPVPVFTEQDYFVYYFCIKKLESVLAINRVDGTFGGWRLGGNIQHKENAEAIETGDSPGSGLNPAAYAQKYGEFNSRIRDVLSRMPDDIRILEIDIANFYDCIRVDRLQRQVRAVSSKTQLPIVDLLFYFLSNCNRLLYSYRPQSTGIPQDVVSDCSRLLANFYLQEYDEKIHRYCKRNSIEYLRFADDQLFFVPSDFSLNRVCKEASKLLYGFGLNINQKKVQTWGKDRLTEYRCLEIFDLLNIEKTNNEQLTKDCQDFADSAIEAVNKHRNNRNKKYTIHGNGVPLLKKCIGLNLNRLDSLTKAKILKMLFDDNNLLAFLKSFNMTSLYQSLDNKEKQNFINEVEKACAADIHAAFTYESMRFMRSNGLKWRMKGIKVTTMTKEWLSE